MTDPYQHGGLKFALLLGGPCVSVLSAGCAAVLAVRFMRRRHPLMTLTSLALTVLPIASWWLTIPLARRWTGWADHDGNGVLDGMGPAGRYDSVDFYGGHWGALVLVVALGCLLALAVIRLPGRGRSGAVADQADDVSGGGESA